MEAQIMSTVLIPILHRLWFALLHCIKNIYLWFQRRQSKIYFPRTAQPQQKSRIIRAQKKPDWVKQEVIRLKAFIPHDGCRKIADTFNRLYADKRHITVGKTFVYSTIQTHQYEIKILRRHMKNRHPRVLPKSLIWSMDLTQVTDNDKQFHTLFGIIDSGTRACLFLKTLQTKASIILLRCLLDTIENYGKPKAIRTDNEAVFTSRLFRFGLWILNIKHQITEVCCPWMNGKIERFFGTLKQKLTHYSIQSVETLASDLVTYRFWYNHVRTHQHLNGLTPAEAWSGKTIAANHQPLAFSAWNDALAGIYLLPS